MHNVHGSMGFVGRQRFLPWHRVYLLRLEEAMQAELIWRIDDLDIRTRLKQHHGISKFLPRFSPPS
jgi:hypothetical protein